MDKHHDMLETNTIEIEEMLPPCSVGPKNQSNAWDHFDKLQHPS